MEIVENRKEKCFKLFQTHPFPCAISQAYEEQNMQKIG